MRTMLESIESEYRRYKALGEGAIQQLTESELSAPASPNENSVATLVWHLAGNFKSRFTNFLTSDGEKPSRDRDSEFVPRNVTPASLREQWDAGWAVLFGALAQLEDDHLHVQVSIRGRLLAVHEALHRSLAHASYHVGQIVFLAKTYRGAQWRWLSIPPGGSAEYNKNPTAEKGPAVVSLSD